MIKLLATLRKELLIVLNDRVGLLLMYLMPVVLVVIITLVQDSSFRMVSENRVKALVVNDDKGTQGAKLVNRLKRSGSFRLKVTKGMSARECEAFLLDQNYLLAVHIPENYSEAMESKAGKVIRTMLEGFGLSDSLASEVEKDTLARLKMYYDPVLQDNYRLSVTNGIYIQSAALENELVMQELYRQMGYDSVPLEIASRLQVKPVTIEPYAASVSGDNPIPNSTQHNVPAWSVFAMFFMVVSLGGTMVRERHNGTFERLRTIPSAFALTIFGKMIIYLGVAVTQLLVMLAIGVWIFPLLDLPQLTIPDNLPALCVVTLLCGAAAVSYAVLIGTYAGTPEQANGFGAVSIIIFAAIGGIWVPAFIMPGYLQSMGKFSPLYWCLRGFYTLFLRGGNWHELREVCAFLGLFIAICQSLVVFKLRRIMRS